MAFRLVSLAPSCAGFVIAGSILVCSPVRAQVSGDDNPRYITASYSPKLARYYAPYALQANAAYVETARLDETRAQPDGADVGLVIREARFLDEQVASRAAKYLAGWRYQFGSEGRLECFEDDPDCIAARKKERWRWSVPGGPAFQVWARQSPAPEGQTACREVSIAFRGTTGDVSDWIANLQPVTVGVFDDHYRQLKRNLGAIFRKIAGLDCYRRASRRPQIVSVGHSLGAGLAQHAALAAPKPYRISKVFAFDPSPVTGANIIEKGRLARNARRLEVDRIYQAGEVLQRVRWAREQFPRSDSACRPLVRTVVYDALQPTGSVVLHSMRALSGEMVRLSYDDEKQTVYQVPVKPADCPTRYRPVAPDDELAPAPEAGLGQVSQAGGGLRLGTSRIASPRSRYVHRPGLGRLAQAHVPGRARVGAGAASKRGQLGYGPRAAPPRDRLG